MLKTIDHWILGRKLELYLVVAPVESILVPHFAVKWLGGGGRLSQTKCQKGGDSIHRKFNPLLGSEGRP